MVFFRRTGKKDLKNLNEGFKRNSKFKFDIWNLAPRTNHTVFYLISILNTNIFAVDLWAIYGKYLLIYLWTNII